MEVAAGGELQVDLVYVHVEKVLIAIGVSHEIANGTVLFTLGIDNTESDVDLLLEKLPGVVQRLREMSPLYQSA